MKSELLLRLSGCENFSGPSRNGLQLVLTDQNLRQITRVSKAEIIALLLCRDFVSTMRASG